MDRQDPLPILRCPGNASCRARVFPDHLITLLRVFVPRLPPARRGEHSLRRRTGMEPAIEDVCPDISGEDGPRWMEPISHDEDAPQCRICFDGGCFGEQGPLFRPCRCSGSMAWVHRECLDQWRRSSANPRSFFRCDNCLFEYRFGRAFVAYDRCSATVAVPLALAPAVPPTEALTRTLTLALTPPCRRCTPGSR